MTNTAQTRTTNELIAKRLTLYNVLMNNYALVRNWEVTITELGDMSAYYYDEVKGLTALEVDLRINTLWESLGAND